MKESYFETEINIPVRVHYCASKGCPATYWEPGEPAEAEIYKIEIEKRKVVNGKVKYEYIEMPYEFINFISKHSNLEEEALEAAEEEEYDKRLEYADRKYDEFKEEGKYFK